MLIANDITFKAGSFGTREDVVFKMASEFARDRRIPRLFIAANSGARIGLADRVKKKFKAAFKDPSKPENGFNFLYVEEEDYKMFTSTPQPELKAEPVDHEGRQVYKITDVIGSEPDLGVENLKGSGLIAGETSRAYEDIFTLTIVLGRTVGIGAYLVRLGQRTIQKSSASPIILTGYQALNKLMGVEVYSTNDQLGGPGIMYPNGVSHQVENDHLRAVKAAVDWLSYVPSHRKGLLPISDIRGLDSVDRPIAFTPTQGVPYDPRTLLAGYEDDAYHDAYHDAYGGDHYEEQRLPPIPEPPQLPERSSGKPRESKLAAVRRELQADPHEPHTPKRALEASGPSLSDLGEYILSCVCVLPLVCMQRFSLAFISRFLIFFSFSFLYIYRQSLRLTLPT